MQGLELSESRPLRVLIAGLGHAGRRTLRNLARLVPVQVVAYRHVAAAPARDVADLVQKQTTDLEEGLSTSPDLVLVTNPTSRHVEVALEAARRGCHLFLEKPVSDRLEGVEELVAEVRRQGTVCLVGYNARFRPTLLRVRDWVRQGQVGDVLSVQAQIGEWLPNWHPEEDYRQGVSARRDLGGGVLFDLSHELDYVPWLVGPVRRLTCFTGQVSSLEMDTEDLAEILLEHESGAISNLHMDCLQQQPSRTCRILGEAGVIHWDALKPEARLTTYDGHEEVFVQPEGERARSFELEMRHLVSCLRGEASPDPDLEGGLVALRLAVAARTASETGRAVAMEGVA